MTALTLLLASLNGDMCGVYSAIIIGRPQRSYAVVARQMNKKTKYENLIKRGYEGLIGIYSDITGNRFRI